MKVALGRKKQGNCIKTIGEMRRIMGLSKGVTRSEIENAFVPSREISDAQRFAGRVKQVETAYFSLISEGTNIAIIGNRAIGKTSLARQVLNLASGNNDLLKKIGLQYDEKLDFLPIYFACGQSVRSTQELIERLLTTKDCLGDWIYDIPAAKKEVVVLEGKIDLKLASSGGSKQYETDSNTVLATHSLDTIFVNVLTTISKEKLARNGILIVIDEFDQIADPSGFASLLKSLATNAPQVKFCLVGVAHDIKNLMREHASTDRLFAGSIINLPVMTEDELRDIIEIAETSVNNQITFTETGKEKLVSLAQGHPYMVHLLGKYALLAAFSAQRREIDADQITATLQDIASQGLDPVLEGRYKKAIGTSPQRESVLRALAKAQKSDGEIHTKEAYTIALNEFGVDNPSQYVGHLGLDDYGAEIEKIRERYYRFKDSLFHAYVVARPRCFELGSENED